MYIELTNCQTIYGLSNEERSLVKEALTFDNPKYKDAKRFSRSGYTTIPPYLKYYTERSKSFDGVRKKVLEVPIGVNVSNILPDTPVSISDCRSKPVAIYPDFELELRDDQKRAEESYLSSVKTKQPKCIVQLPTGKGKSILALHLAYTLGVKTLILVHKDDLVVGWQKDIQLCFPGMQVGLIKAKKRVIGEQITIATVQTLSRMDAVELKNLTNKFGLVVQDECHHVGLNIFNIIDKFESQYKLGLSATPNRSDGLDFVFDLFFGGICHTHTITKEDKDICSVEVRVLDSPFKYKPFIYKGNVFNFYDFKEEDLPKSINFVEDLSHKDRPNIPYLNIDDEAVSSKLTKILVCKNIIKEYREGHSVIALFTQKKHIDSYYRYLSRYIPKNMIMCYYGDSKEKSEEMMRKAEDKEVLVTLATYAKATEGTNVKSWEVEFLVSSINNKKNVEQATGRIRRVKEGKLNPVIVYDIRYKDCYSLRSHYNTRESVYDKLRYKVKDPNKRSKSNGVFSRGYLT